MSNIANEKVNTLEYDVAVIGSGCGGIGSAVSAARQGAKVLVAEKDGFVGGLTASGLPYLGYLDVKKRTVLGGIAQEYVQYLKENGASFGVRYCPKHLSQVSVDADKVKIAAGQFLTENGVDILLHSNLIASTVEGGKITEVLLETRGVKTKVKAGVFIDATGDGTLSYLSGAEYEKGEAGKDLQPPSVIFTIGGVNKPGFFRWIEAHPEELGNTYTMEYLREAPSFAFVTLHELWKELYPKGEWPMDIWAMICMNRFNEGEVTINGPKMAATDPTDNLSVTKAELLGQKQANDFVKLLNKYVGGFENAYLCHINDKIGVRETRRVLGCDYLTVEQVQQGNVNENTIALGSYPIDIHGSGDFTSSFIHVDEPYGIPYLITCNRSIDNLMMAGRCVSVDNKAYGSVRVMGTLFAVSEAAGVGAGLAVKHGMNPRDVPVKDIREILLSRGAILSME